MGFGIRVTLNLKRCNVFWIFLFFAQTRLHLCLSLFSCFSLRIKEEPRSFTLATDRLCSPARYSTGTNKIHTVPITYTYYNCRTNRQRKTGSFVLPPCSIQVGYYVPIWNNAPANTSFYTNIYMLLYRVYMYNETISPNRGDRLLYEVSLHHCKMVLICLQAARGHRNEKRLR